MSPSPPVGHRNLVPPDLLQPQRSTRRNGPTSPHSPVFGDGDARKGAQVPRGLWTRRPPTSSVHSVVTGTVPRRSRPPVNRGERPGPPHPHEGSTRLQSGLVTPRPPPQDPFLATPPSTTDLFRTGRVPSSLPRPSPPWTRTGSGSLESRTVFSTSPRPPPQAFHRRDVILWWNPTVSDVGLRGPLPSFQRRGRNGRLTRTRSGNWRDTE